jgi:hypothetical protein
VKANDNDSHQELQLVRIPVEFRAGVLLRGRAGSERRCTEQQGWDAATESFDPMLNRQGTAH